MKNVYIAGPMTGIPQFNFPAFDALAAELRGLGFGVTSPAEMDDPETRAAALASPDGAPGSGSANGQTWGDFLARDVKLIADSPTIEGIVCLDDWSKSRGARLETFVAMLCSKPVFKLKDDDLVRIPARVIIRAWAGHLWSDFIDDFRDDLTGLLLGRRLVG